VTAYNYVTYCIECVEYKNNWIKYVAITFFPITLLYVLLLVVKLDTTRTILRSYILFAQILTAPSIATLYEFKIFSSSFVQFIVTIHGIWNLDFGRSLYSPFCLHPNLSIHQVVALDYLTAFYPLLLIVLTFLLVKLHDNYKVMVVILRPFYCCIRHIQKEWNIKTTLIDVFATFLLLSNVKLLNVSFELISVPVTLYNATGHSLAQRYTYLNSSIVYLGKEHQHYFALGITVILIFNVFPIVLIFLYPFRCFQRCLNYCSLSSPSLHIFMDALQGCYKTTPHDYRSMAALPFFVMLLNFISFLVTRDLSYFILSGCILSGISLIIMASRPYKRSKCNYIHALIYLTASFAAVFQTVTKDHALELKALSTIFAKTHSFLPMLPTTTILIILIFGLAKRIKNKFWKKHTSLAKRIENKFSSSTLTNSSYRFEVHDTRLV